MFIGSGSPRKITEMIRKYSHIAFLLIMLTGAWSAWAQESVVINISSGPCPYADSRLSEKLKYRLSSLNHNPIIVNDASFGSSDFENLEQILARGRDQKARLLIDVIVDKIDLARKKNTFIPIALCRYRIFAVLSGKIRIIDVTKGRIVSEKDFRFEAKGIDQWQILEDDPADPGLFLPADAKIDLFDRLEETAGTLLRG